MILKIDTTSNEIIKVTLLKKKEIFLIKEVLAPRTQAENLLPTIISLLEEAKISWPDLGGIQVVVTGGSFTSLRIGVLTANALAYAANLPLQAISSRGKDISKNNLKRFLNYEIAIPKYKGEPNIGKTKKKSKEIFS